MKEIIKNKLLLLRSPQFFISVYYKIFLLIVISFLWYYYKTFIEKYELLYNIVYLIFYYFLLNVIFNYGKLGFIYLYIKKNNLLADHSDNFTVGIDRLSFFLNHFIYFLILIDLLFIDIQLLLTSLSIFAVAFVLIFKDYISNFLNGINLMFSKDFRIKDTVKVGDNKGNIIDFTFHNVHLKNENGDIIFIPNTTFLTKEIINFSKSSLKNINIDAVIPRSQLKNMELKKKQLITNIVKVFNENIQTKDNVSIFINKLEKETANIIIELYLPKYSSLVEKEIRSYILTEISILFSIEKKKKKET